MKRKREILRIPDAINCTQESDFTQVPNELLRNPEISAKAKTILCILLSNRFGWTSYLTSISQQMKEGTDAIRTGLKELENYGYLMRIRVRKGKGKKEWVGSFWGYTDTSFRFNLRRQVKELNDQDLECVINKEVFPDVEIPDVETSHMENSTLIILIYKKNNIKKDKIKLHSFNIKNEGFSNKKENKTPSIKERNKQYLKLAKQLSAIVQDVKDIKHPPHLLTQWSNEIRKLSEMYEIPYSRIENVLKWYAIHVGGEYIPVVESGKALREKFDKLENAIRREKREGFNGFENNKTEQHSRCTGYEKIYEYERKKELANM